MITPITNITLKDVEILRRKPLSTNGLSVSYTEQEVDAMQDHLSTNVYTGKVTAPFAAKIVRANKFF